MLVRSTRSHTFRFKNAVQNLPELAGLNQCHGAFWYFISIHKLGTLFSKISIDFCDTLPTVVCVDCRLATVLPGESVLRRTDWLFHSILFLWYSPYQCFIQQNWHAFAFWFHSYNLVLCARPPELAEHALLLLIVCSSAQADHARNLTLVRGRTHSILFGSHMTKGSFPKFGSLLLNDSFTLISSLTQPDSLLCSRSVNVKTF